MTTIPRIIHHIWVGNRPAPDLWMATWREKHPDWEYRLHGNDELYGQFWVNQKHIDAMVAREAWAGVADLMRYEILYEQGGFLAPADSQCLLPIDELFEDERFDAYSVYENEKVRQGLVSPLLACTKGNPFARALINTLFFKEDVGEPWLSTGNLFMQHMIGALEYPRLKIWPSYHFVPVHYTGEKYEGGGKVYATHEWGSMGAYDRLPVPSEKTL